MRTLSASADAYHLQSMVERMVRDGLPEDEIVAAVEEAEGRPAPPARRPVRRPMFAAHPSPTVALAGPESAIRGEAAPAASPRIAHHSARVPHPERLEPRQHFLGEVLELADVVDEAQRHATEAGVVEPLDLGRDVVG